MSGSGVDEDTARAVQRGRETLGALIGTAQSRLQVVFIVFALGLVGGILAMRWVVWPQLKNDLLARGAGAEVIAQTPFDVILLQVKLGLIVGILLAVPALLYYARVPLRERGIIPDTTVSRLRAAVVAVLAGGLFVGGALYAYLLFFPIMFSFLATYAQGAGLAPTYSIVAWTQFILVLGLSFGLAAQLPLVMVALSYSGIVPYEVWRDRWKYAIVIMFAFGAVFSPPDPFTQAMWALPLVALYGFSLYLTRIVVTAKRGRESIDPAAALRRRWNRIAGAAALAVAAVYGFFVAGGREALNRALLSLPGAFRPGPVPPAGELLGMPDAAALAVLAAVAALLVAVVVYLQALFATIDEAARGPAAESGGAPADIDLDSLDAAGVRAAPPEVFAELDEDAALATAREAMETDQPEKAQAILDRFDEVQEAEEEADEEDEASEDQVEPEDESNVFTRTSAGMLDAFTEDETTEDDIGGYYHDIAFILNSLRSRVFRIVAVFMLVLAGVFTFLYSGGIALLREDFISRIPAEVRPGPEASWPITLHPVEALVFEAKISALLGAVATLPLVAYYAWPALEERGLASGDRRVFGVWAGGIIGGIVVGSVLGYLYVAPEVISWLVYDAIRADMIIAYRVSNFFWLVFLTTSGIGLLFDIPITMLLFWRGGIVSYDTLRRRWRVPVLSAFLFGALVTPDSIWTMFLIAIPVAIFYGVGLFLLWVVTLGGRRGGGSTGTAESV